MNTPLLKNPYNNVKMIGYYDNIGQMGNYMALLSKWGAI
jgi:hypothetical protein